MKSPDRLPIVWLTCMLAACGASCLPRQLAPTAPLAPAVFSRAPTLQEVIQVVNAHTQRVQRLQTSGATLAADGYSQLQADLALEQPRRFRLRAGTGWTGPELDLGSNDELLWIWVNRQPPGGGVLRSPPAGAKRRARGRAAGVSPLDHAGHRAGLPGSAGTARGTLSAGAGTLGDPFPRRLAKPRRDTDHGG